MTLKTLCNLTIALLFIATTTGCGKQENKQDIMPEATNETCTLENQKKFGTDFSKKCTKEAQEQAASEAFRSGSYTKSSGRKW